MNFWKNLRIGLSVLVVAVGLLALLAAWLETAQNPSSFTSTPPAQAKAALPAPTTSGL